VAGAHPTAHGRIGDAEMGELKRGYPPGLADGDLRHANLRFPSDVSKVIDEIRSPLRR
jgi:hypothetical protein